MNTDSVYLHFGSSVWFIPYPLLVSVAWFYILFAFWELKRMPSELYHLISQENVV